MGYVKNNQDGYCADNGISVESTDTEERILSLTIRFFLPGRPFGGTEPSLHASL